MPELCISKAELPILSSGKEVLSTLPANQVEKEWAVLKPILEKGCLRYEECDVMDFYKQLVTQEAKAVLGKWDDEIEFLILAQLYKHVKKSICYLIFIKEDHFSMRWKKYLPGIEDWAKTFGCNLMKIKAPSDVIQSLTSYSASCPSIFKSL